jgi:phage recombination protein Bet
MTSSLATAPNGSQAPSVQHWTDEEKKLIKSQIAPGASDNELRLFQAQCQRTGLDPFSRQIYAIMRDSWDPKTKQTVQKMTIQTSIDGFRVIAQRSGKYAGQNGPYWCGADGEWKDVWLSNDLPAAAKVLVFHRDFDRPVVGIALFSEYAAKKKDGTLIGLWKKGEKPTIMIAKCAEALAFRKAFPNDLSGLYTAEEMSQADVKVIDAEVVAPQQTLPPPPTPAPARSAAAPTATPTPAPEPAPAPVAAEVVPTPEPAAAAPSEATAAPAAEPEPETPEMAELILLLAKLNPVGTQALFKAYKAVKGFDAIETIDAFIEACKPQIAAHLAGLKPENIAKLNEGLHPRTGAVLVSAEEVPNDPAKPFG